MSLLKEVSWSDVEGNTYEGISLSSSTCVAKVSGEGLFSMGFERVETEELSAVLQTSFIQGPSYPYNEGKPEKDGSSYGFRTLCRDYLRDNVSKRMSIIIGRFIENFGACQLRILPFKQLAILKDFDYLTHFSDQDPTIRFFAMYGYAYETFSELKKDYKDDTEMNVLKDSRISKSLCFLGAKTEEIASIAKLMSKTSLEYLSNLERLIAFLLQ